MRNFLNFYGVFEGVVIQWGSDYKRFKNIAINFFGDLLSVTNINTGQLTAAKHLEQKYYCI